MSDGIAPLTTTTYLVSAQQPESTRQALPVSNISNSAVTSPSAIVAETDPFNPSSSYVSMHCTSLEKIITDLTASEIPTRAPNFPAAGNRKTLATIPVNTYGGSVEDLITNSPEATAPYLIIGEGRDSIKGRRRNESNGIEERFNYMKARIIAAPELKDVETLEKALIELSLKKNNPKIFEIKICTIADVKRSYPRGENDCPDIAFLWDNIPHLSELSANDLSCLKDGLITTVKFPGPFRTSDYVSLANSSFATPSDFDPHNKTVCVTGHCFKTVMESFTHLENGAPLMKESIDDNGKRPTFKTILLDSIHSQFYPAMKLAGENTAGMSLNSDGMKAFKAMIIGEGIEPENVFFKHGNMGREQPYASIKVRIVALPDKPSIITASEWVTAINQKSSSEKKIVVKFCSWKDIQNCQDYRFGCTRDGRPNVPYLLQNSLTPEQITDLHQRGII